jgi:hypothetical protein
MSPRPSIAPMPGHQLGGGSVVGRGGSGSEIGGAFGGALGGCGGAVGAGAVAVPVPLSPKESTKSVGLL